MSRFPFVSLTREITVMNMAEDRLLSLQEWRTGLGE